jgi:hypothetical protein
MAQKENNEYDVKNLDKETKEKIRAFNSVLNSLSSLHDKKKQLWQQIYENSVIDRRNAYIMFYDLYEKVHGNPTEHAIHGTTLAKYLERLNKSNEQLIQLANILDEAVSQDENELTSEGSMYERLEKMNDLVREDIEASSAVIEDDDEESKEDESKGEEEEEEDYITGNIDNLDK